MASFSWSGVETCTGVIAGSAQAQADTARPVAIGDNGEPHAGGAVQDLGGQGAAHESGADQTDANGSSGGPRRCSAVSRISMQRP
jgi:hypothetical protein